MGGPNWNDARVKDWVGEFMAREGRFPTTTEMDNGGPSAPVRRKFGNMPGIAALVGVDPMSVRQIYKKDLLDNALHDWVASRDSGAIPKNREARRAYKNGDLQVHPRTLTRNLGTWDEIIKPEDLLRDNLLNWFMKMSSSETPTKAEAIKASQSGQLMAHPNTFIKRFGAWSELVKDYTPTPANIDLFNATDSVGFVRNAAETNPDLPFNSALWTSHVPRVTPSILDVAINFPEAKDMAESGITWSKWDGSMSTQNGLNRLQERVKWEDWQITKNPEKARALYIGYSALSLTMNPRDLESGANNLSNGSAGPSFSEIPLEQISGLSDKKRARIWLADQGHQVLEDLSAFRSKRREAALNTIDPIFITEIYQNTPYDKT